MVMMKEMDTFCLLKWMILNGLGLLMVDEGGGGRGRLKMVLLPPHVGYALVSSHSDFNLFSFF